MLRVTITVQSGARLLGRLAPEVGEESKNIVGLLNVARPEP
jgi:hypothetical protein